MMFAYRILVSIFAVYAVLRTWREAGRRAALARLGVGWHPARRETVWLHAASNGELTSARSLIDRLLAAPANQDVLVTCTTPSGVALARSWALDGLRAELAPVDLGWVTRRLMRRQKIAGLVLMEAELWPHRVLSCPGPVLLMGARLGRPTARIWARFPRLARRVLARVSYVSAQDRASLARLRRLGLPSEACGPVANLKTLYAPAALSDPAIEAAFDPDRTWLAASTHEGEEEIVAQAHRRILDRRPGTRLILAIRHPDRGDAVEALLRAGGLTVARRSRGDAAGGADVYLADRLGEMPLWYRASGVVFVAGSLTDRGGHTPYEPAHFGRAILHGPDTRNFAQAYCLLHASGASRVVSDADTLADAVLETLPAWRELGARAQRALGGGDAARAALDLAIIALRQG